MEKLKINELSLPIPYHSTFDIFDASKISEFQTCPRKYFYKYIMGWNFKGKNVHPEFGEAWHRAMEHIRLNGYTDKVAVEAGDIFEEYYRRSFSPMTDSDYAPKNPGRARIALQKYIKYYERIDEGVETLYTEIFGAVPVSDTNILQLRIDSINRSPKKGIFAFDYKTGSRYSIAWQSQWITSMQMNTYNHALRMNFQGEKVSGMIVDGIFLYTAQQKDIKDDVRFARVPVYIPDNMVNAWLYDVNYWCDSIKWEFFALAKAKDSDPLLKAFPKNTKSCIDFGRVCQYHGFCTHLENPLRHQDLPPDFEISRWNPQERENIKYSLVDGKIQEIKK